MKYKRMFVSGTQIKEGDRVLFGVDRDDHSSRRGTWNVIAVKGTTYRLGWTWLPESGMSGRTKEEGEGRWEDDREWYEIDRPVEEVNEFGPVSP